MDINKKYVVEPGTFDMIKRAGEDYYYVTKDNNELVKLDNCPRGNDGWSELEDGTRVWQLQIEVDEDEWESYPVWFEDKDKAYIFFNNN